MDDGAGLPNGAVRALVVTTTGFTLMFAVWLMFGVLFVVTAIAAIWMHLTVVRILQTASPEFAHKFEHNPDQDHAEQDGSLAPGSTKGL